MPSAERALCDTGPLVAMADTADSAHEECRAAFESFGGNLVTTWPVLAEAFYFLESQFKREFLWEFTISDGIEITDMSLVELPRMRTLMAKYASLPMDFADASLLVVAERFKLNRVFTLDRRDFQVYRPANVHRFEIFP